MHIRTRPSTKITLLCLQLLCGESAFPCRQLLTMVKGVERIKEGDWGGKGHFSVRPQVLITDSLVLFFHLLFSNSSSPLLEAARPDGIAGSIILVAGPPET